MRLPALRNQIWAISWRFVSDDSALRLQVHPPQQILEARVNTSMIGRGSLIRVAVFPDDFFHFFRRQLAGTRIGSSIKVSKELVEMRRGKVACLASKT